MNNEKKKEQYDFKPISKKLLRLIYNKMKPKCKYSEYIKNVKHLDGYFIFEMGKNSVLHFELRDCPGWNFGVWWSETKEKDIISGEFFAQYNQYINKFKPSDSEIRSKILIVLSSLPGDDIFDMLANLCFIRKHPYLARFKDLTGTNFNYTYTSKLKAFLYVLKDDIMTKYRHYLKNKVFNKYKKLINKAMLDEYKDCEFILKDDENCSPRFEMYIPQSQCGLELGYYGDVFEKNKNVKYFERLKKFCDKHYIWGMYEEDFHVIKDKEFGKLKKKAENMKKNKLKFYAFIKDRNTHQIRKINIFGYVWNDLLRIKKVLNKDYKVNKEYTKEGKVYFEEKFKTALLSMFWCRVEYEVLVSDVIWTEETERIDVYDQLMMNWELLKEYTWEHLKDIKGEFDYYDE